MTLNGIARCIRTKGNLHTRYKGLDRFLNNNFQTDKTILGVFELTIGEKFEKFLPLLIDQIAVADARPISGGAVRRFYHLLIDRMGKGYYIRPGGKKESMADGIFGDLLEAKIGAKRGDGFGAVEVRGWK